jgi:hypothetical protein
MAPLSRNQSQCRSDGGLADAASARADNDTPALQQL